MNCQTPEDSLDKAIASCAIQLATIYKAMSTENNQTKIKDLSFKSYGILIKKQELEDKRVATILNSTKVVAATGRLTQIADQMRGITNNMQNFTQVLNTSSRLIMLADRMLKILRS
jgi:hypothetical protein